MIQYSPAAKLAIAILFRQFNDVDIYVEDQAGQTLHTNYFRRLLEGKYRIERVFDIGDRKTVLEAWENRPQDERRRLFVIDPDLDLLTGNLPGPDNSLCVLERYSIENYLMCVTAAAKAASFYSTAKALGDLRTEIEKFNWNEHATRCGALYVLYGVAFSLGFEDVLVGYNFTRLQEGKRPIGLSQKKIRARIREVLEKVTLRHGRTAYRARKKVIVSRVRQYPLTPAQFVSAKAITLPLLHQILCRDHKFSGSQDTLKAMMSEHCEIDPNLRTRVVAMLEKQGSVAA